MSGITAALIVKNEAGNLPRCLDALKPLVDEVVVVDTGSIDGSEKLAASLGAKTGFFKWVNNFAAARNAALEMVETDWVFSVDADEVLDTTRAALDTVLSSDAHVALVSVVDAYQSATNPLPRIFRMVPGIHWEMPVHEQMVQPVSPVVVFNAQKDIRLIHYGYAQEVSYEKAKRNLEILKANLDRNKTPHLMFFFARECIGVQDPQAGLPVAMELLKMQIDNEQTRSDVYAIAAWLAGMAGNWPLVLQITKDARSNGVPSPYTEFIRANALAMAGKISEAISALERCCAMPISAETATGLDTIVGGLRHVKLQELRSMAQSS